MADLTKRKMVLEVLKCKIRRQPLLIENSIPEDVAKLAEHYHNKYIIKYGKHPESGASIPPAPEKADFHNVDIKTMDVDDARTFGGEHLCKQIMDKLELENYLKLLGWAPKMRTKALISITARALFCASEYKTARLLEHNSELARCYEYKDPITHKQLYTVADELFLRSTVLKYFLAK